MLTPVGLWLALLSRAVAGAAAVTATLDEPVTWSLRQVNGFRRSSDDMRSRGG